MAAVLSACIEFSDIYLIGLGCAIANSRSVVRPAHMIATAALSENIQSLAASLDGSLSEDAVAKWRKQLELQSELIDHTLSVVQ